MSTISDDKKRSFAQFERHFQEKIIQALLTDRIWAAQLAEVINIDYFEFAYLKHLARIYFNYYTEYKDLPTLELFIDLIKKEFTSSQDVELKNQLVRVIGLCKDNKQLGDLQFVKNQTMNFCRQQSFKNALIKCTELIEDQEHYDNAIEIVKKAIAAGQTQAPGLPLDDNVDIRYSIESRRTIRTNIRTDRGDISFDDKKFLNGGAGSGELCVVVANSGVGKSHVLTHIGSQALLQKKNVLHITLELNEKAVAIRYDSHLVGINSLDCFEHKEEIRKYYQENQQQLGKLRIKYFPTGTATVNTVRMFVEKLSLEDFKPHLLIVDYAQIMRSTEKYDLLRLELKKIFEELRALATELDIPVWTACQATRDGSEKDLISMANMAEGYSQAHICDFILGVGRPEAQKATGFCTLFIAKNRNGIDGVQFKAKIDTAQSRLILLSDDEINGLKEDEEKRREDEGNMIRRAFRDISTKKMMGKDTTLVLEKFETTNN